MYVFLVFRVLCLMVLYVFDQWYFVGPLLVHVMPCCPVIWRIKMMMMISSNK